MLKNRISIYVISCQCHQRSTYFNYFMAVSFIGRRNQSTRTKPPTCRKSGFW